MLVDDRMSAGVYTVDVDGTRMASGMYYYRLTTPKHRSQEDVAGEVIIVKEYEIHVGGL